MKKKFTAVFGLRKASSSNDVSATGNRARAYSCYKGGTVGVCSTCRNHKLSCNCQHCRGCGGFMMALRSRHHCRICWRPFCPRCSKRHRVSEFMDNGRLQPSRACDTCAVPQGLIHVSGMFDGYSALWNEGEDGKDNSNDDSNSDNYGEGVASSGRKFHWGLYALLSVIDAPRRCINPSCAGELSYSTACKKCKVPTVTCALHEVRSVDLSHSARGGNVNGNSSSPAGRVDRALAESTERKVAEHQALAMGRMSASDVDTVYARVLPNRADSFALQGLREDSWGVRKALLARIAAAVAGEHAGCPNISLAACASPEAQLLNVVRSEPLFTVFECPGLVNFVAFAPTTGQKALERRLSRTRRRREVWRTDSSSKIGVVCKGEADARSRGGMELLGEFGCPEGILKEVEETRAYADLARDVISMMGDGTDIVLCGFSTGGAIAALLSTILLVEHTDVTFERLQCVTFGAPLFASKGLSEVMAAHTRSDLSNNFQHFVNASDVLPRLSFLDTFIQSGTMGSASVDGTGHTDGHNVNMAEVREVIVSWLSANQQGGLGLAAYSRVAAAGGGAASSTTGGGMFAGWFGSANKGRTNKGRGNSKKMPAKGNKGARSAQDLAAGSDRGSHTGSDNDDEAVGAQRAGRNDVYSVSGSSIPSSEGHHTNGSDNATNHHHRDGSTTINTDTSHAVDQFNDSVTDDGPQSPRTAAGDIFARDREPFENNRGSMQVGRGGSGSPALILTDTATFASDEYRDQQPLDPYGCYHILWRGQEPYSFSRDPARTLALLSSRSTMRVLLKDHLLASYDKAIVEYMNSAA